MASEDLSLGVDTVIGGSPYRLKHDESLVGLLILALIYWSQSPVFVTLVPK